MSFARQRAELLYLASVWIAIDGLISIHMWLRRFSPPDAAFAQTIFGVQ